MRSALAGTAALFAMTTISLNAATTVKKSDFGKMPDGAAISLYTLTNSKGMEARIMTYGGILVSLKAPDRKGAMVDVVLGHDSLAEYVADHKTYFGALIGRYANRIGHAQFKLDGVVYKLPKNDGENSLHGGTRGFDKHVWSGREVPDGVELTYVSKDGEEGYPGNLKAVVTYRLLDDNRLQIHYAATTDKDTVINLSNHSYWNLKGSGDILGNLVTLNADRFTPIDAGLIPTGELRSVANTVFDFRKATAPGARINQNDPQLKLGKGYDHNWVLNRSGAGLQLAARVEEPSSGRVMEVYTDQPGIQFYTGNFLDGTVKGKGGKVAAFRSALCLETQHFPDSPNKPSFPSAELKPGQKYDTTTEFRFSAK
ncbi:MAG TPA: aldose epimerase family protein [Bryobacteraceae bacterium]|nr:aldose epimerase family protein [Bryobacteraceae bacterium]